MKKIAIMKMAKIRKKCIDACLTMKLRRIELEYTYLQFDVVWCSNAETVLFQNIHAGIKLIAFIAVSG